MSLDLLGPTIAAGGVTTRPTETRNFGAADTFFRDCSSPTLDDGTEYQAAFFNALLANARTIARGNGQTATSADVVPQDNSDDAILWKAFMQLVQRGQPLIAQDTGAVGHIVAAYTPAVVEHKFGLSLRVKVLNTNTGATDFAPSGLAPVAVKRIGAADLQPGDLRAGGIAELVFDGAVYQIVSFIPPSQPGTSTEFAPKLVGVVADQAGAAATSVPSAVATNITFGHTAKNNLVGHTSTFNGTTLTIGAGEAGIWDIRSNIHIPGQGTGAFEQIAIFQNGAQVETGTTTTSLAATGSYVQVAGSIVTNVGDTIVVKFYHQYGSTISTAADNTTNFSALLASAY
jgi:hypothetical protein